MALESVEGPSLDAGEATGACVCRYCKPKRDNRPVNGVLASLLYDLEALLLEDTAPSTCPAPMLQQVPH